MRTTVDIDKKLLDEATRIGGNGVSAVVNAALEEYIRKNRAKRLLASLGTWDLDLDDADELRHEERT